MRLRTCVAVLFAAMLMALPARGQTQGGTFSQSAAAEGTHIFKASTGNLFSIYATNLTTTAGFLVVVSSATVPADGALVGCAVAQASPCVLDCVPLPASGNASINFFPGPPVPYLNGIVAVLTSAVTCLTKTTGVITGFIKADVQ